MPRPLSFAYRDRKMVSRHMNELEGGSMRQIVAELVSGIANAARETGLPDEHLSALEINFELTDADVYALYDGKQLLLTNL
jgi:hypothetical protein